MYFILFIHFYFFVSFIYSQLADGWFVKATGIRLGEESLRNLLKENLQENITEISRKEKENSKENLKEKDNSKEKEKSKNENQENGIDGFYGIPFFDDYSDSSEDENKNRGKNKKNDKFLCRKKLKTRSDNDNDVKNIDNDNSKINQNQIVSQIQKIDNEKSQNNSQNIILNQTLNQNINQNQIINSNQNNLNNQNNDLNTNLNLSQRDGNRDILAERKHKSFNSLKLETVETENKNYRKYFISKKSEKIHSQDTDLNFSNHGNPRIVLIDEIVNTENFSRRSSRDVDEKNKNKIGIEKDKEKEKENENQNSNGNENSKIFLISQSVGFSVKNKFITEENLKKMLFSCQNK